MIQEIKELIGKIMNYIGDVISRVFDAVRSLFRQKIDIAQKELDLVIDNNNKIVEVKHMKPPTTKDVIIGTITNTIAVGVALYRFTNVFSNYLIRFATDRRTHTAVKKYIKMDRYKRLERMNCMLINEAFDKAGISIPKETTRILSTVIVQIYDKVLDDYKPLYDIMVDVFEQLEVDNRDLVLIDCCERRCQDIHIVMKTSRKNKVNIIRFGRATNLDLSIYATNKNFAKIAVISQLEFCNMFAIKSITSINYDIGLITSHTAFTVNDKGVCEGMIINLHNKIVERNIALTNSNNDNTIKTDLMVENRDNKENSNKIFSINRNDNQIPEEKEFIRIINEKHENLKINKNLYKTMYNVIYGKQLKALQTLHKNKKNKLQDEID